MHAAEVNTYHSIIRGNQQQRPQGTIFYGRKLTLTRSINRILGQWRFVDTLPEYDTENHTEKPE